MNNSRIAAARSQSAMLRWRTGKGQRRRSRRGGKSAARSAPRALLPALLPLQPHQKAIGQHDGDGMAMKPFPEPALVLIPAQQLFSFFMILLHPGTTMDILDHDREGSMSREVTPIVFAVTRLAAPGPLADQPAEVGCPIPIHAPAAQGDKLAPQRARTALPPGDC